MALISVHLVQAILYSNSHFIINKNVFILNLEIIMKLSLLLKLIISYAGYSRRFIPLLASQLFLKLSQPLHITFCEPCSERYAR
jgi:hypothetical protein